LQIQLIFHNVFGVDWKYLRFPRKTYDSFTAEWFCLFCAKIWAKDSTHLNSAESERVREKCLHFIGLFRNLSKYLYVFNEIIIEIWESYELRHNLEWVLDIFKFVLKYNRLAIWARVSYWKEKDEKGKSWEIKKEKVEKDWWLCVGFS
jgi:hypothetical protein